MTAVMADVCDCSLRLLSATAVSATAVCDCCLPLLFATAVCDGCLLRLLCCDSCLRLLVVTGADCDRCCLRLLFAIAVCGCCVPLLLADCCLWLFCLGLLLETSVQDCRLQPFFVTAVGAELLFVTAFCGCC